MPDRMIVRNRSAADLGGPTQSGDSWSEEPPLAREGHRAPSRRGNSSPFALRAPRRAIELRCAITHTRVRVQMVYRRALVGTGADRLAQELGEGGAGTKAPPLGDIVNFIARCGLVATSARCGSARTKGSIAARSRGSVSSACQRRRPSCARAAPSPDGGRRRAARWSSPRRGGTPLRPT